MNTITSINPRTGKAQFEPITTTDAAQVDQIVRGSKVAWESWSTLSPGKRAEAIRHLASALDREAQGLAEIADLETALGIERLVGEVARTSFQLRMFADELDAGSLLETTVDLPVAGPPPAGRPRLERRFVSLGPVAVFGAGNFPFAFGVLGGDTASALAAGCTVVAKEHPGHPMLSRRLVQLAQGALAEAGVDAAVIQGVAGLEAGVALVSHPLIQAVGFTGSQHGGRALFDIAQSRPQPIPFYGELGSVNPVFLTEAALSARATELAAEAAGSITLGRGQFCTKPAILFVPDNPEFLAALTGAMRQVAPGPLLGPAPTARFLEGASALTGAPGAQGAVEVGVSADGLEVTPGLITVSLESYLASPEDYLTECFGPLAVVVICDGDGDFARVLPTLSGALVATIQAEAEADGALVADLVHRLSQVAGRIVLNAWPTGLAVAPAQHHGGPYPASTSPLHTSVGLQAMMRFVRPVVIQNAPPDQWPSLVAQ